MSIFVNDIWRKSFAKRVHIYTHMQIRMVYMYKRKIPTLLHVVGRVGKIVNLTRHFMHSKTASKIAHINT